MHAFFKGLAGVLAGFVAASAVMMAVEYTNGHVLYPEFGKAAEGIRDAQAMQALMAQVPAGMMLVVLFGWALGSFVGGALCARLASRPAVLVLAVLLTLAGVANNLMMPPPLWFWVLGLVALFGGTLLGTRTAQR